MAEIKSTLDIIMEKTRNLTLSAEEKRAFHEEEIRKKMLGLVQRFLDGHLQMKQIGDELNGLKEKDRVAAAKCVREECAKLLDPEGNNDPVLLLLRQAGGADTGPVERLLAERRTELEKEKADRGEVLRERYEARGISGSAVVPNPEADPEWRRYLSEKQADIQGELAFLLQ